MGIKVHGNVLSTCTMKVTACLYEKDMEFEFVPVDMQSGAHMKEPFLSLNPFGKVPAFEDGDLHLIESRAISQYIANEYSDKGTQLIISNDSKTMAKMSLWMEVEAHHFDPVASKLAWELVFKKIFFGQEPDSAVVQDNVSKLAKVLDIYEVRLGQSKYLAGETFSLADLHNLPVLHMLKDTSVKNLFEEREHVNAWCNDILARPAWGKVVEMQKQALG